LADSDDDEEKRSNEPKHHPEIRWPHLNLMPQQVGCGESQENHHPEENYS